MRIENRNPDGSIGTIRYVRNEAAERLLIGIGDNRVGEDTPARRLMNEALAAERRATVERIRERFARIVEAFPTANRTQLYSRTLAFAEWLAQVAEQDEEAAR